MKSISLFLVLIQTVNLSFSQVCKTEFEETICENFQFSPDLMLNSSVNKLLIKNAKGRIIHENFSKLDLVIEIKVTESEITGIEPGALCCVSNVTSISLVNNKKLPKITKSVFKGCQQLKKLNLDGPGIDINNLAFTETKNLQTLSINDSFLPHNLNRSTFRGLESLKSLLIQNSRCGSIKEDAFSDLKNLKFLELQSNKIETLPPKVFRGLTQLKVLNLGDNKLKNLTWDEFEGLKALRVLFLERNDFDFVDVDKLVASVPNLERVFFSYEKLSALSRKKIEETLPKLNITFIYIGKPINDN